MAMCFIFSNMANTTMKTLNVQKIDRDELLIKWGIGGKFLPYGELFIRSDRKGNVNFDKAPVYTWKEIKEEQKKRPVHFTIPSNIHELVDY